MTANCDTCRSPGSCCSRFMLSAVFDERTWREDATVVMRHHGVPFFHPVAISLTDSGPLAPGTVHVLFDCDRLIDGRCSDYDNRPRTCTDYQAGSDLLCAEHVAIFRGIPLSVENRWPQGPV